MHADTSAFNAAQSPEGKKICSKLAKLIDAELPEAENKMWHRHPVWFLDGNPIVGYSKLKDCIRLMFWSGADFDDGSLTPGTGKFKDASVRYTSAAEINEVDIQRWLSKSREIQWDYKNVAKRKGKLERLS
ncbi:DUF1801 domain-containing protein [Patescibacteria group bacterium]|jgi:hypothetical protein|nr:DUF1801 domain-containing protein [Patescibacteria group bacterium]